MNIVDKSRQYLTLHSDEELSMTAVFPLLVLQIGLVAGCLLPDEWGGKNSLPEYIQLGLLLVCGFIAFTATDNRRLFTFAGLVLIFLAMREINYGRTLWFFAHPEDSETFPKWKEIPCGWLAHTIVGVYLTALSAVFIWKKLYRDTWNFLKSVKFPAWECSILIFCALCAQISERIFHNNLAEEFFELTMYVAFTALLWRFSRGKYKTCEAEEAKGV